MKDAEPSLKRSREEVESSEPKGNDVGQSEVTEPPLKKAKAE